MGRKKSKKIISRGGAFIRHPRVGFKFRLELTLLKFNIILTQKGYFQTKKKMKTAILHIQINLDSKF